jgi:DNA-binding GntR family transcriptional regulator
VDGHEVKASGGTAAKRSNWRAVEARLVDVQADRGRPGDVYSQLRDLIVHGRLAPGARLIELELAARLGVSRTPLRAALQRLQQEGYAVDIPTRQQSRLVVAPMTQEDAREVFHLVGTLEGLAAYQAAQLAGPERARLAAEMKRTNAALKHAAEERHPEYDRLFELDERFHRSYVMAGAGPRLFALHDAVKPQAERYERLYVSLLTPQLATSVEEHERIRRAIRDGRPRDAHVAVQTNWRNAATRLGKVIERAGERGTW